MRQLSSELEKVLSHDEPTFEKLGTITTKDIIRFQNKIFQRCQSAMVSKGNDYSGNGVDTFANIRLAYQLGLVKTPAASAFVRGLDKVMRIKNLTDPDVSQAVKDESIQDTLEDLINYFTYIVLLDRERREMSKMRELNAKDDSLSSLL